MIGKREVKNNKVFTAILTGLLVVLVTGSSWSAVNTMPWISVLFSAKTGYLVDSGVAGVSFASASRNGITASGGSFRYKPGEPIRFFLGQTVLGECNGQEQVSLFDLIAGATIPIGNKEIQEMLKQGNSALSGVINQAVLLQTLDRDDDPSNGIEISSQVAALFGGVNVDFLQEPESFSRHSSFSDLLKQANKDGLFPAIRPIRNWGLAMNHLYQTLNIDPKIFAILERRVDTDADGHPETIVAYQYDANGKRTREEYDRNGDGNPNRITTYHYDANGKRSRTEYDSNGDGTPSSTFTYQYDANGNLTNGEDGYTYQYDANSNLTRKAWDWNGDGNPEYCNTYQYDAAGNRTWYRFEEDYNSDGILDDIRTRTYQYDANGNLIRKETDESGYGTPTRIYTYQYDANGNMILEDRDFVGHGDLEGIFTYQYDANGNQTREERDYDRDGSPNYIFTYQYDVNDSLVWRTWDYNGNGSPNRTYSWQYDANGNLTREEQDSDGDGTPNRIATYRYDANGNLTREERNYTENDHRAGIYTYQYDANGNLTREEWDYHGIGTPDEIYTYQYDANGNRTRSRYEGYSWDGILGEILILQYDTNGNLIQEEKDDNGDGVIDNKTITTYQKVGWSYMMDN